MDRPEGPVAEEMLIAEQTVSIHERSSMTVRILQHEAEDFWRVDVTDPGTVRGHMSTTVASPDSFLMFLIQEAVSGQPLAWQHLAQWGQDNLTRPGGVRPTAPLA
jgi:hypothetical protein